MPRLSGGSIILIHVLAFVYCLNNKEGTGAGMGWPVPWPFITCWNSWWFFTYCNGGTNLMTVERV